MIIKDLKGTKYRLTKTRLITVRNSISEWDERVFYIFLSDVMVNQTEEGEYQAGETYVQLWLGDSGPSKYIRVLVKGNSIGCREFDTKTMRLIRKAIKEAKRGKKKKSKQR
jgi:hypothetical protein